MDTKDVNVNQGQQQTEEQQQQEGQTAPKLNLVLVVKIRDAETAFRLEEGQELIIGADPQASVPVDDDYISARHLSIKAEGGQAEVKDLGSRNGLFLKIDEAHVSPGQTLLAGKTFFRVEEQKDECI